MLSLHHPQPNFVLSLPPPSLKSPAQTFLSCRLPFPSNRLAPYLPAPAIRLLSLQKTPAQTCLRRSQLTPARQLAPLWLTTLLQPQSNPFMLPVSPHQSLRSYRVLHVCVLPMVCLSKA